jgi:hypothetical protein
MASVEDSEDEFGEFLAIYLYTRQRRKKKQVKRFWVHNILKKRHTLGEYNHLLKELEFYDDKFFTYYYVL